MKILFDQGTPAPLRAFLSSHEVYTAYEQGWSELSNSQLLDAVEGEAFEVLITTDRNLKHQQNLADRHLGIIVLLSTSWPRIQKRVKEIQIAVKTITPGDYIELQI